MTTWLDRFTGQRYSLSDEQLSTVRDDVAREIAKALRDQNTPQAMANAVAKCWQACYYERVFPLRFGRQFIAEGAEDSSEQCVKSKDETLSERFTQGKSLGYDAGAGTLKLPNPAQWRTGFLDGLHFPPILPAETQPDTENPYLLASDHHLATAALLNVCLRRAGVSDEVLHEARLGALLHELIDLPAVRNALQGMPLATALAQYLKGETADCPDALRPHQAMLDAIHRGQAESSLEGYTLCLVGLAAQRIKQYVFETPGLPEIRGASLILDYDVVHEAAKEVADAVGRECILQQVAATLIFLAPAPDDWTQRLKRRFYKATQVGFCAAAAAEVALKDYLQQYGACMTRLLKALDADRYHAELPPWECLPFETRCAYCRKRAATEFTRSPNGDLLPICPACDAKREKGDADERRREGEKLLRAAGVSNWGELLQKDKNPFAGGLNELVPDTGESEQKKQVAFIYGDGSNFGQITKNLNSLALSLQWTRRAELTVRAAVALAVSRSMHDAMRDQTQLQRMPFEVLVIGGDDFSLFVWSRLAMRFCEQFVRLTDMEFEKGNIADCIVGETPICFDVGCLISDEKAPVYRVVDFTERRLLKFAKRGVKAQSAAQSPSCIPPTPTKSLATTTTICAALLQAGAAGQRERRDHARVPHNAAAHGVRAGCLPEVRLRDYRERPAWQPAATGGGVRAPADVRRAAALCLSAGARTKFRRPQGILPADYEPAGVRWAGHARAAVPNPLTEAYHRRSRHGYAAVLRADVIPAAQPEFVNSSVSNPPSPRPSPPLSRGERAGSGGILHAQEFVNSERAIDIRPAGNHEESALGGDYALSVRVGSGGNATERFACSGCGAHGGAD